MAVALSCLVVPLIAGVNLPVGDVVPDFEALDQDDATFRLSDEAGKVVLLHLATGYCLPCRSAAAEEADLTLAVDSEIGADNWVLVDVLAYAEDSLPSDAADASLWRSDLGTPARTLHGGGAFEAELHSWIVSISEPGVKVPLPTHLVVAPDGTLSFLQEDYDGIQPLIDAVVAAWYAHETPETTLADLISDLEGESGVGRAIAGKLNAAYALMTDDTAANDQAVLNILRAVLRQVEAQAGKQLSIEQADYVTGIVAGLIDALQAA